MRQARCGLRPAYPGYDSGTGFALHRNRRGSVPAPRKPLKRFDPNFFRLRPLLFWTLLFQICSQLFHKFRQGFSEITDPQEKIKFTLASYNAGIGHVYDAQRLAEKYGKNPNVWEDNVAEYIRLKSDPEYYNDPVCKHGYLRGSETFNYVREVMERYNYYKSKTKHS